MTLHDVAEETGYSKALISRIENDSVSPSITSLIKITTALQFSLHELFAAVEGSRVSVVKKNKREFRPVPDKKITVENLCQSLAHKKMDSVIKTFEPGAAGASEKEPAGGEQWWHLLKGNLELTIGDEKFELGGGDSIYFYSSSPYKCRNPAKRKASVLIVTTPPAS